MNELIKELATQAANYANTYDEAGADIWFEMYNEKFAELIIQDCADFVRETYDHEAAESIAWNMEIKYGLHGDYA